MNSVAEFAIGCGFSLFASDPKELEDFGFALARKFKTNGPWAPVAAMLQLEPDGFRQGVDGLKGCAVT